MLFDADYKMVNRMVRAMEDWDGTDHDHAKELAGILGRKVEIHQIKNTKRSKIRRYLKGRRAVLVVPAKGYSRKYAYHAVYWHRDYCHDPAGNHKGLHYGVKGLGAMDKMIEAWVLVE